MRPNMNLPRPPVDLDNCAREPIHIPGSIQPHGVLLALDPQEMRIVQWSANAPRWLGTDKSQMSSLTLRGIVDDKTVARVQRLVAGGVSAVTSPLMTRLCTASCRASARDRQEPAVSETAIYLGTAHLYDGVLILEFETRSTEQILLHTTVEEGTESITRSVQRATAALTRFPITTRIVPIASRRSQAIDWLRSGNGLSLYGGSAWCGRRRGLARRTGVVSGFALSVVGYSTAGAAVVYAESDSCHRGLECSRSAAGTQNCP